jgi:hypothetical protein
VTDDETTASRETPETPETLESPAYPALARTLAVILVVDLVGLGAWSLPALRGAQWSASGLVVFALAMLCVVWVGYWILYSRTRLEGDVITQTWLWNKREDAANVAQLKLVHSRWLERVMAPRLLVKRRNGSMTWIHSADARLLTGFAERVAERMAHRAAP